MSVLLCGFCIVQLCTNHAIYVKPLSAADIFHCLRLLDPSALSTRHLQSTQHITNKECVAQTIVSPHSILCIVRRSISSCAPGIMNCMWCMHSVYALLASLQLCTFIVIQSDVIVYIYMYIGRTLGVPPVPTLTLYANPNPIRPLRSIY